MSLPHSVNIPEAAMRRLSYYLRGLTAEDVDRPTISSERLAAAAGTTPATLRKDLGRLGVRGRPGVGYEKALLVPALEQALGVDQRWRVAIIGAGHLGTALAGYSGFAQRGFPVVAVLDSSPEVIGTHAAGIRVADVARIDAVVAEHQVNMAVLTVPAAHAQALLETVAGAGVRSVLSFAPVGLTAPAGVMVRRVDLSSELSLLAHRTGPLPH